MLKPTFILFLLLKIVYCNYEEIESPRICIIGAGVSGLSVTYFLQKEGLKTIDVYEKSDFVGGTWKYDPNVGKDKDGFPIHTSMYKNLRTNLPRHTMEFPDFRMPENVSTFPSGNCFYKYIQKFVDRFDLRRFVKFRTEVTSVKRINDSWIVEGRQLNNPKITTKKEYDYVIICSGHNSKPNWPKNIDEIHANFSGVIIHAHDYREPLVFKDKKVLIVGAGPSGLDIGVDIARVATKLVLSHHYSEFKSPFPSNFVQRPDVERIENNTIWFTDDSVEDVDIIIYCTGYQYYYPFVDKSSELEVPGGYVIPLHKNTVNIHQPTMMFIGLGVNGVVTLAIHTQAKYAALLALGKFSLPPKDVMMKEWEARANEIKNAGKHLKQIHYLGPKEIEFHDGLTDEAGIQQISHTLVRMGQKATASKLKNLYEFRNDHYRLKNDTIFTIEYRPGEENCDLNKL